MSSSRRERNFTEHFCTRWHTAQAIPNRTFGSFFGDELYAREELVAELTSALCGASFGIATIPQDNNAAYLKHWLTKLKEEPAFLVEILGDVNKAAKMIADKVTEPMNEPAAA